MALSTPRRLQGASPAHARAKIQEKLLAARTGGAQVKGSGCGAVAGDVRLTGVMRLECKTTSHKSFTVTPTILDKLDAAVVGSGEIPILQIELELGKRRVIIMPDWALDLVLDRLKDTPG